MYLKYQTFSVIAERLANFRVVLSSIQPPVIDGRILESHDFRPCASYRGVPPAGKFSTLKCTEDGAIGRYMYLYLPARQYLTACEIEAFGIRK